MRVDTPYFRFNPRACTHWSPANSTSHRSPLCLAQHEEGHPAVVPGMSQLSILQDPPSHTCPSDHSGPAMGTFLSPPCLPDLTSPSQRRHVLLLHGRRWVHPLAGGNTYSGFQDRNMCQGANQTLDSTVWDSNRHRIGQRSPIHV